MVTLNSADSALKSFYLDAVADALNTKVNPFLAKIQKTSNNVTGKDVKKLVRVGINGGVSAGTETGELPTATGNKYMQLTTTLKNLYGSLEISDKAIRASANNEGAFVNLLNDEMQSIIKSANYNFSRMLFGDGTGKLGSIIGLDDPYVYVDEVKNFVEGMRVDCIADNGTVLFEDVYVEGVVYEDLRVHFVTNGEKFTQDTLPNGTGIYLHGSKNNELTGLGAIFALTTAPLYGVQRDNALMKPYRKDSAGKMTENLLQIAIDNIEERSGSKVDFILCSWGVRRALLEYYKEFKVILPSIEISGGTQAISFNGIPVVADRFCPKGTMYLLNSEDFKLNQLCDWQWLEAEDGKILKQVPGKPVYTATLVKYAELMCERPCGQGVITGITEV